jgi:hypothetical protein
MREIIRVWHQSLASESGFRGDARLGLTRAQERKHLMREMRCERRCEMRAGREAMREESRSAISMCVNSKECGAKALCLRSKGPLPQEQRPFASGAKALCLRSKGPLPQEQRPFASGPPAFEPLLHRHSAAMHWAAMHWAALNGHVSTVVLLGSMGADVNAPDAFQSRPLHYAADAGHPGYPSRPSRMFVVLHVCGVVSVWCFSPVNLVPTLHKRLAWAHPRTASPLPAPRGGGGD